MKHKEVNLKRNYKRFNHHDYNSLPRSQKNRETQILRLKLKKMGFSESCIDETCTVFYYSNDMSIQDGIEYAKQITKDYTYEPITYQELLRSEIMSNPLGYLK